MAADAAPVSDERTRTLAIVTLLAGVGMVVGSFLPWLKVTAPLVGTFTKSGMEGGDGWVSLMAGVVVGIAGLSMLNGGKSAKGVVVLAGLVVGALCIYEYSDLADRFAEAHAQLDTTDSFFGVTAGDLLTTSFGAGLHLIAGSAVGALVSIPPLGGHLE